MGASYMFYGWWDWRFLGLILFSSILDFFAGKFIESSKRPKLRKAALSISLIGNLGLLATFKYYDFFILSLQDSISEYTYIDGNHLYYESALDVSQRLAFQIKARRN